MAQIEVGEPILNSPFEEPREYWHLSEGHQPEVRLGRRRSVYHYRDPNVDIPPGESGGAGTAVELALVNLIRERVKAWRCDGYPGVTRTTLELLQWWRSEGRERRLFFAQLESAETIIFLKEARADFLQGIEVPRDEPSDDRKAQGYKGFARCGCKMATGSGKTTVMGMVAAWSVLNKVNDRGDARFSDVVLVVCPNVTIRDRLNELDPERDEASIYRTRDLVPAHLMPSLRQGRVLVINWHVFEQHTAQAGGVSARVVKAGVAIRVKETIAIGPKTTTARGTRYLSLDDFNRQVSLELLTVLEKQLDKEGHLRRVTIESVRYVESDTALVNRVLGLEVGGKQNILVMNDEAHHAYRIHPDEPDADEEAKLGDVDEAEEFIKEATVWVEGLDRIDKNRGINFCLDLSATPFYLARAGHDTNRPFPWVVSDFGLVEAIESGLVKIPQMAVRDTTGDAIPGYFNIWQWIMPKLTAAERGGKNGNPKPEAILKWAHHPMALLGGLWEKERAEWAEESAELRSPVFIIVCKNTTLAKVIFEWLAENKAPIGIPPANIAGFLNMNGVINTIRVDSKVVRDTNSGQSKNDESRWMRFTLDTVGNTTWTLDSQKRPIYPEGFEQLANKLKRSLQPPGRDVRCIVSVGMLTEGWDCNTVTHIIGLRPFMSQLLCEQVVGRGLRRKRYELTADGRFSEEVAKVFGVPFEVIPMKTSGPSPLPPEKRHHVYAVPEKVLYQIVFPRVDGYTQAIRNRVTVDWINVAGLVIDPGSIPPEVQMKASVPNNQGRMTLSGPGRLDDATLAGFRARHRLQELVFEFARTLTREYTSQPQSEVPAHALFPQLASIVQRYLREKVEVRTPASIKDLFLAPYYGWVVERLVEAIHPDAARGEAPEVPRYEKNRGQGSSAEVDFWTSRDVREVLKSHLNYAVADTKQWEQSATYYIDKSEFVEAFVKNAGLGFAISYLHNGEIHDYVPDFIIRMKTDPPVHLILETKGYDPLEQVKRAAAERWVAAVNADATYGLWGYALVKRVTDVDAALATAVAADPLQLSAT
jgi:type III restriction enzyme